MSSYVISKRDYIRVAGILAGISSATEASIANRFWIYDHEEGHPMNSEGFIREFTKCFELNAKSVMLQYHDPEPEMDDNDYREEFDHFYKIGRKRAIYRNELDLLTKKLNKFFRSALYQTEDEDCANYMEKFFCRIIMELLSITSDDDLSCGGEFSLTA